MNADRAATASASASASAPATATATATATAPRVALFAATIALAAFLLFLVQPLIARYILPWFGGSPAVWAVCMVFFQVVLLAGYVYAHLTARYLPPKLAAALHVLLLLAALAALPITPSDRWRDAPTAPGPRILLLLTATVGLPFFLLSTTTPLMQAWVARAGGIRRPYRLYALSNAASLAALVAYPVVVEPTLGRRAQSVAWSIAFAIFAVLAAACAIAAARSDAHPATPPEDPTPARSPFARFLWLLLPATGVVLLLGTTNRITQEVAAVPFLWVVPLALYLLTFVVAFDAPRWYARRAWLTAYPLLVAAAVAITVYADAATVPLQLAVYGAALFAGCMICHGELARLKPGARGSTAFYVCVSAGGAAGGLFVALLAPVVFTDFLEYPLAVVACGLLALAIAFCDKTSRLYRGQPAHVWMGVIILGIVLGYLVFAVQTNMPGDVRAARRNFYGALAVVDQDAGKPGARRLLRHGRITHGLQRLADPRTSTAYYGHTSGLARALDSLPADRPRRVGVVGLGAGTVAAFARPGDTFVFYEIDPDVVALAREHFTFLKDCPGAVEIVLGDGRLSLDREPPRQFDLLAIDAFSGDAVPTHLLTRQAFDVYRRHLAPSGVIVVNVTNRHVDLRGVVASAADHLGMTARLLEDDRDRDGTFFPSDWVTLSPASPDPPGAPIPDRTPWTDDRVSLWSVLKWRR